MSIKMIDMVFHSNMPELKTDRGQVVPDRTLKLVMLSLADCADERGEGAYPGLIRLCHMTNLSKDTVANALNALRTHGFLRLAGKSRWRTNHYVILVARLEEVRWPDSEESTDRTPASPAARLNPSLNRQLNRPPEGLSEKPNAEPGEQIKVWTEISRDPAIKPHLRVEAIQSLLGARLNIHAATKRWKELAAFVDARQQEQGQMLETFLHWLTSSRDFDLRYWPPGRMLEMWPQAFSSRYEEPSTPLKTPLMERLEELNGT